MNKKIICIIPARYGSTRLPGKMLKEIDGLPLVMWTYRSAVNSGAFSDVYVATDDPRIENAVKKHGGRVCITSKDHTTGTDRVNEAAKGLECDFVVNLQGDEPLIPGRVLSDFCLNLLKIDHNSLLTCVTNAKIEDIDNPDVVKTVLTPEKKALYFSRAPIPYCRSGVQGRPAYKHIGIYGFTDKSINRFCGLKQGTLEQCEKLEQLRALENGMDIYCLETDFESAGIDNQEDLDNFRKKIGKGTSGK